ncbi:mannose-1-phosphate guanylyltransferase [Candidatus Kryptobacter tengchongensis]|uniref:mannose-1-phosphate guanylyltransferase n=1 Tax=Kryptobacter tengchongensis TaxID=1643429 RepID=A0A916LIA4_KRYT1|nr:mannose-1-phosphate guanylyltransferase [Candidatus Kryptobacter tengchongensis]CUS97556.1 mannose-1-phosphate guanylyltransferase [Candidatus Kryptobacter tengchongensis]
MASKAFAVIMAGGVGSRFWPKSRARKPKQFLNILSSKSLIEQTIERINPLIPEENILIVSNKNQTAELVQVLPKFPIQNIILEPLSKNTAPCIGLASLFIKRHQPDAVMVVLPSDHLITDVEKFLNTLKIGIESAYETMGLITIGIQPTYPSTGYGYIQFIEDDESEMSKKGVYKVKTFAEKPDLETAQKFLDSGDFLWNSGMFIWRVDVILDEIKTHLPDIYEELMKIDEAIGRDDFKTVLEQSYGKMRAISIDYGVMEKTDRAYVIKASFGWSDVGSWEEVYNLAPKDKDGNYIASNSENVILIDVKNCLVEGNKTIIAMIGVEDLIVVSTEDAILICKRDRAQDVRNVVNFLKRKNLDKYL